MSTAVKKLTRKKDQPDLYLARFPGGGHHEVSRLDVVGLVQWATTDDDKQHWAKVLRSIDSYGDDQ